MKQCFKCKRQEESLKGSLQVKGGRMFFLCDQCPLDCITTSEINEMPRELWVETSMRKAMERRANGQKSIWDKY